MKKYLLLFLLVIVSVTSCKKDDQTKKDDVLIEAYLKANNIPIVKDDSGIYYQIITPGGTSHPTVNSAVNISYVGSELDGTVFDKNANTTLLLTQVIKGWQYGVPKIGIGGEIKLFIPSALGYGNNDQGVIAANSVLVFDISLFNFSG